jgi:hypothetical protein
MRTVSARKLACRQAAVVDGELTGPDYAAANAPPQLNYGWVYPQALLVFTITLVYSVVSPLILVFGAIYFGVGCEFAN